MTTSNVDGPLRSWCMHATSSPASGTVPRRLRRATHVPTVTPIGLPTTSPTTIPQVIGELIQVVMVRDQTRWMLDILEAPLGTGVVVVTTP